MTASECDPLGQAWLTTSQVARVLGVSSDRIRQLAEAGRLPCDMTPLGRLFSRQVVLDALERRQRPDVEEPPAEGG